MKLDFLNLMKCPYCGSNCEIGDIYEETEEELLYGILKCRCNEYPIVEGILNLKITSLKEKIISLLREGNKKDALAISLLESAEDGYRIANLLESSGYGRILGKVVSFILKRWINSNYKRYVTKDLSFCDLRNDSWIKHRFSIQTLWSNYPFIPILKERGGNILDLGCWTGHLSYVIYNCVNPERMACIDRTFSSLYLNRKYFVNEADFVCFDLNYPLPFKDKIFTSVILSDTFPYIYARALLSDELDRVTLPEGFCLVAHLRNSLVHDYSSIGRTIPSLPPSVWSQFFKQHFEIKVVPEKTLIEDFIERDMLDLSIEYSTDELNSSDPICIIASKDKSIFTTYKGVMEYLIQNKDHLIINPIYNIEHTKSKIILERKSLGDQFTKLYPLTEKYLPHRFILDRDILKPKTVRVITENLSEEKSKYIEDLMKKFIIISVPSKYL